MPPPARPSHPLPAPTPAAPAPRPPARRGARLHVALLFNANKVYDREILAGIGSYLHATREDWDLFVEDDFRARLDGLAQWPVDGLIADFDDPGVAAALRGLALPVVAVGGSYADPADYPAGLPYVATDNAGLVGLATGHLRDAGLRELALYSLPESPANRWAQQRERAFEALVPGARAAGRIHRGRATSGTGWALAMAELTHWLAALPQPVGIVAVNDVRARHLLQACTVAGLSVPEQVAIVGIDDDPLTRSLTRIGLSSVRQGAREMGRTAARLLHRLLRGGPAARRATAVAPPVVVAPEGLNVQASSRLSAPVSPLVMRARQAIRLYGCQGTQNSQLAEQVGVSRATLEAAFRRELGSTVHQALLAHRLEVACGLLAAPGDTPLAEVAQRAGFGSASYLSAVFRRELGTTPSAWRRQQQALSPADQRAASSEGATRSTFSVGSPTVRVVSSR